MRVTRRTPILLALALALAPALAACTDDGGDGDAGDDDDASAAGSVAAAFDASSELSRLVVPLEASTDLAILGPDAARARKVQTAITSFRALAANPLCVKVATDNLTYLEVTFDQCRVAVLTVDGSIRAGVAIGALGGVPTELTVTVTIPSLVVTGPLRTRRLSGAFELRQRISPAGGPVALDGELSFVPHGGAELSLALAAEWQVSGECVAFTGGAQLSGGPLGARGPIALSGEGVRACRGQCPSMGSVELSHGRGELLAWTYTGASTISVIGPRGRRVEVPLACGD